MGDFLKNILSSSFITVLYKKNAQKIIDKVKKNAE